MNANRLGRDREARALVAGVLALALLLAACGKSSHPTAAPRTTSSGGVTTTSNGGPPQSTVIGRGVTDTTIKIGIGLVDFQCIKPYITSIRFDEYKVYQAFIDNINDHGGVAGRKLVPVYKTYCPITSGPAVALCTTFAEDEQVFAVIGDFVDLRGGAQPCLVKDHHTVLITINLTEGLIASSPPGLMLTAQANKESLVRVVLSLLKKEHTLDGKTVAVLGEATTKETVDKVVVPGLKNLGVKMGSTAVLTITSGDTTVPLTQLQSFIEKWKTEGVDAVFMVGQQVSAKQFVPTLRKAMPKVILIADNSDVDGYGQQLHHLGVKPNPYEGVMAAGGVSAKEYDKSANWKYCADIYEHYTHQKAPNQEAVVPGPKGYTLDVTGAITDACSMLTMFHDIGQRVGKYLDTDNWAQVVDHYGQIRDMQTLYGSLHKGKYDANDTFALVAYDSSIGIDGDWRYLTKLENTGTG